MKNYSLQDIREKYILQLEEAEFKTKKAREIAVELYTLGLTMYSKSYSLESIFFNSFAQSFLDENISLHPEQINVINEMKCCDGVIFSAPTSFGKTFVVFEYIAREKPKNVVLIVPTLALIDEYNKKIIKKYKAAFGDYKVYLSIDEDFDYNFDEKNIFILTHDRIVEKASYSKLSSIDFLVIDEVYKLQRNESDDRVLVLNLAYYHLVKRANKHLLLAPFIGGVENIEMLEKIPLFYKTNYSPVVNKVKTYPILDENDRNHQVCEIIESIPDTDKTMIYFPTVTQIFKFVQKHLPEDNFIVENQKIRGFIEWIKNEIHEKWYLVKAMEHGYLVHNGQLPIGIRMFQLDLYDDNDSNFNKLFCTATLLEGVNTSAKHIIISKPSRSGDKDKLDFDAFDFYNLVGRSGRLLEHFLGIAHYVKGPHDPSFKKEEAIKKIEFEITQESLDIDIHLDNIEDSEIYQSFIKELGISHDNYKEFIGSKLRFQSVLDLYDNYKSEKEVLITELNRLLEDEIRGRIYLVNVLYKIFDGKKQALFANIINQLLNKSRLKVKSIIDNTVKYFPTINIDYIITTTLRLKSSYVEYDFYSKLMIVMYFMRCENIEEELIDVLDNKIKKNIEYLYFSNSKAKKMLKDLGIYERDIDKIIKIIGDSVNDTFELKKVLITNRKKFSKLSIVSQYVIDSLI